MNGSRRTAAALLLSACAGFSTAETAAVVAATTILAATAAPQIEDYLENARGVKALGDVRVIALSIVRLWSDVGQIALDQKVPAKLLVTEGEIPDAAEPAARPWTLPQDNREAQSMAAHLVDNEAGYPVGGRNVTRWRGPYLEGLSADPWGSRYAANVGLLRSGTGHVVIVLSPGPNRLIETPYETIGLKTGGDDVIGLVGRGR
ncbi:MAG: hypothetical protein WD690_08290 [Vicinamibacterales bacterium]